MVNTNIHTVKLNKYLSSKAFNTVTTLTLNLNALIVIAKTPVKFPKPTNDRWYFEAKMGLFGRQLAVLSRCLAWHRPFFRRATNCVSVSPSYIFSAYVADLFSWISRWIVRPATLDYRPTDDRQNLCLLSIGWHFGTWRLILNVDRQSPIYNREYIEGRLDLVGNFGKSADGWPTVHRLH